MTLARAGEPQDTSQRATSRVPALPTGARWLPTCIGLFAFGLVWLLWVVGARETYHDLLTFWGIVPFRYPFVDTDALLATWECARIGVDFMLANPCDVLHRPQIYAPSWNDLAWIPLTKSDRAACGVTLAIVYLVSLGGLPLPLTRQELFLRIAATLSSMTAFVIERGNIDSLIFVFTLATVYLLRGAAPMRWLGYAVASLGGLIKYYPFILLAFLVRERWRAMILGGGLLLAALVGFFIHYGPQIRRTAPIIPSAYPFGDMFGAKNFGPGIFMFAQNLGASRDHAASAAVLAGLASLLAATWLGARIFIALRRSKALARMDEPRRLCLAAGAFVLVGCFFAGQSVAYRGIFLLLALPGLAALAGDAAAGLAARAARIALIGIVPLMWSEALRLWGHLATGGALPDNGFLTVLGNWPDFLLWAIREIAWWGLIAVLGAALAQFVTDQPVFRFLGHRNEILVPATHSGA